MIYPCDLNPNGECPFAHKNCFWCSGEPEPGEEPKGETLDDYLRQRDIDALAKIYGGEEPPEDD